MMHLLKGSYAGQFKPLKDRHNNWKILLPKYKNWQTTQSLPKQV